MSYAEYGANVFLPKKLKIDRLFIRDEELAQVGSGCKLKMHKDCFDVRAWSQNETENFRYFREVTENPSELEQQSSIISEYYSKYSISNNSEMRSESIDEPVLINNNSVEQNNDVNSTKNENESIPSSISHEYAKSEIGSQDNYDIEESKTESENTLSNESIASSYTRTTTNDNYGSTGTSTARRSDFDDDSTTESEEKSMSQDDISSSCDSQTKDTIIKNEAMLISLENELKEKNMELEELKEINENLLTSLRARETVIEKLQKDLKAVNINMNQLMMQHNSDLKQWKIESSNLIDQLQCKLEERNRLCREQQEEIKELRTSYNADRLRIERDSLTKKLDDITRLIKDDGFEPGLEGIETLLKERRKLIDANYKLNDSERHLSLRCLDREKEIDGLSKLIDSTCVKYENQLIHKDQIITELKAELRNKSVTIKTYEDEIALIREESEESINEYCIHDDETCDHAFATYIKMSLDEINKFSNAVKGAGEATERRFEHFEREKKVYEIKLQKQNDEIKNLRELNSELIKNTSMINEVEKTNSEMELKLVQLNKKHHDLTNDIQSLQNKLRSRNDKILSLEHEKGILLSKVDNSEAKVAEKDLRIAALKDENLKISAVLKEHEKKVSSILKEMNFLKTENENSHQISLLQEEIQKFELEKRNQEETIKNLREELKNYKNSNMALDKDLINKLNENETLKIKISEIREHFKVSVTRNNSLIQLDMIREDIEALKKRFDWPSGESAKKMDNDQSARKIQGPDNKILTDGHNELENCQKDMNQKCDINNLEVKEKIKYQDNKEEVKTYEEYIKFLVKEKEELSVEMNKERIAHQDVLQNMKQNYEEKLRIYIEDHNQSVLRLREQYLQSEKNIGNNPQMTDPADIIINGKSQLHIVRSRNIFPREKNTLVDDSRISKFYGQIDMDSSLYTDDNKAEQRYALSFRNSGDDESIKREADKHIDVAHDSPCKTFIGHCSSIRNTTKRRNI